MTFNYKFYIDDNRWYVDIPSYPGPKADLEMVCGADTMLAILTQGENSINLSIADKPLNNSIILTKVKDTPEIGGAEYLFTSYLDIEYNYNVWLCDVTKWVFGYLPETIYIQ